MYIGLYSILYTISNIYFFMFSLKYKLNLLKLFILWYSENGSCKSIWGSILKDDGNLELDKNLHVFRTFRNLIWVFNFSELLFFLQPKIFEMNGKVSREISCILSGLRSICLLAWACVYLFDGLGPICLLGLDLCLFA